LSSLSANHNDRDRAHSVKKIIAVFRTKRNFSLAQIRLAHTTPEKYENGGFALKKHQMFTGSRYTPDKSENATITGHFGFVFKENSGRKIT